MLKSPSFRYYVVALLVCIMTLAMVLPAFAEDDAGTRTIFLPSISGSEEQASAADLVQNNVAAVGNNTFAASGSTTITYKIQVEGAGNDGQGGCNAGDGSPVTLTFNIPLGVTTSGLAVGNTLQFSGCGDSNSKQVTFFSNTPKAEGYAITISQISDSGTGGYTNEADFTLYVTAPSDATAPTIECTAPSQTIWYITNVTVNCTASDSGTGLANAGDANFSLSTTVTQDNETATASTGSRQICDKANPANCGTAGPYIYMVDMKAPAVNCGSADGNWHATDVSIACTASDGGSGLTNVNDASFSLSTNVAANAEDANASTNSRNIADAVGNSTPAGPISGNKIDRKAPTAITFVNGISGNYYFGSVPAAPTCTATDEGSGPDTCVVTGYSTAVGDHTLTATAKDKVGNTSTATATYKVLAWKLNGFYQPVDMTPPNSQPVYNTVKNGSTVPLKFELFAGSTELISTSVINQPLKAVGVTCGAGTADDIELLVTGGTTLRYDATGGQFIYNWQTPKISGACYLVTVSAADGSSISAFFKLK